MLMNVYTVLRFGVEGEKKQVLSITARAVFVSAHLRQVRWHTYSYS